MTNGERAVRYMRKMATSCRWKVIREIHYTKTDGTEIVLKPGIWYTGIPYTQGKKKRLYGLFRFQMNLFGGFLFMKKSLVGCDCSSAVSFAWKKVNPKFPILSTRKMLADLFGSQCYFSNRQYYSLPDSICGTKEILIQNFKKNMEMAYNCLKPGDGLLQYDVIEKRGHVMMVSQNLGNNTIAIIDQKGFGEGGSEKEDTSWRVDKIFTYNQLFEEGYLPIYFPFM